jgi:cyclic pyranopterin phosphate synthase
MLVDTHNRVIDYLRISVTDRCNLRCIYCLPPEGIRPIDHSQVLRYEEIVRITAEAVALGIKKIRLTGGEPLVRKDLHILVRDLAALPGVQDLSLTTNGLLLAQSAERLARAGLQRVNVSMDSLDPARYAAITRGGDLSRVWRGLQAARDQGLDPIKINVVALATANANEIVSFARLTLDWPLEVRFIEWMPIGRNSWSEKSFVSRQCILSIIRTNFSLKPFRTPKGNGPAEHFKIPGSLGTIGIISPLTRHFCHNCNRLRLTADGKLRSCLFSDEEIDLRAAVRGVRSDDDIRRHLLKAIQMKPRAHRFNVEDPRVKKCMHSMNRIGG